MKNKIEIVSRKAADRRHPLPVGKRARHPRRTQSHRPDPLGSGNEQRQTKRGGNRTK